MSAKVLPLTTDDTVTRDLRAILRVSGIRVPATWGGWKEAMRVIESVYGLTDDTPFASCEVGVSQWGSGLMVVDRDDAIEIKERMS